MSRKVILSLLRCFSVSFYSCNPVHRFALNFGKQLLFYIYEKSKTNNKSGGMNKQIHIHIHIHTHIHIYLLPREAAAAAAIESVSRLFSRRYAARMFVCACVCAR